MYFGNATDLGGQTTSLSLNSITYNTNNMDLVFGGKFYGITQNTFT